MLDDRIGDTGRTRTRRVHVDLANGAIHIHDNHQHFNMHMMSTESTLESDESG